MYMKQINYLLLSFVFSFMLQHATAQEGNWIDYADTQWYEVNQTTYDIATAEELAGVALLVNEGTETFYGKTIRLTQDIDLGAHYWTPIGVSNYYNPNTKFEGFLDGNKHTIRHLNIIPVETEDGYFNHALIGILYIVDGNATIGVRDLNLENGLITHSSEKNIYQAAALVGYLHFKAQKESVACIIENCHVTDFEIHTAQTAGGLIADCFAAINQPNSYLNITDCSFEGTITANSPESRTNYIGGLIGKMSVIINNVVDTDIVTIHNCINRGTLLNQGGFFTYTAGLVGYAEFSNNANQLSRISMTNCKNEGDITGSSSYHTNTGGLMAYCSCNFNYQTKENEPRLIIRDSENYGEIINTNRNRSIEGVYNGGLIGLLNSTYSICDNSMLSLIERCSNSGSIINKQIHENDFSPSGTSRLGGLIGALQAKATKGSYMIRYCSNSGDIHSNLSWGGYGGGLIGEITQSAQTTISLCHSYNTGEVTSQHYIGGMIGATVVDPQGESDNKRALSVSDCYNSGELRSINESEDYSGGIIDQIMIGGIAGQLTAGKNATIHLSDCWAAGSIEGYSKYNKVVLGGIAGQLGISSYGQSVELGTVTVSRTIAIPSYIKGETANGIIGQMHQGVLADNYAYIVGLYTNDDAAGLSGAIWSCSVDEKPIQDWNTNAEKGSWRVDPNNQYMPKLASFEWDEQPNIEIPSTELNTITLRLPEEVDCYINDIKIEERVFTMELTPHSDFSFSLVAKEGYTMRQATVKANDEVMTATDWKSFDEYTLRDKVDIMFYRYEYTLSDITEETEITLNNVLPYCIATFIFRDSEYVALYVYGERIDSPYDYTFIGGWHLSPTFDDKAWDFENDVINEDITLYARWVKDIAHYDTKENIPEQQYTGEPIIPQRTIYDNDKLLIEGVDYIIECENNIEVGLATAHIRGLGEYGGSVSIDFRIVDSNRMQQLIIPEVVGATTSIAAGTHEVPLGKWLDLVIEVKEGYSLKYLEVKVNGKDAFIDPNYSQHWNGQKTRIILWEIMEKTVLEISHIFLVSAEEINNTPSFELTPQSGFIRIDAQKESTVTIYSPAGALYKQESIRAGITDIRLPSGIWFVRIEQLEWKVLIEE